MGYQGIKGKIKIKIKNKAVCLGIGSAVQNRMCSIASLFRKKMEGRFRE